MLIELPECKRCCLCLPLRHGLIAWGYIRLVVAALLMVGAGKSFYQMLGMAKNEPDISYKVYTVIFGFILVITVADIALNIMFVIGGHKKNLKLLRIYYIYSFVLWILLSIIGVGATINTIHWFHRLETDLFHIWVLLVDLTTFLTQILIQGYVLLLVRSEIIKLTNNCKFRFINNGTETECTMDCLKEIAHQDNGVCENGK